LLNGHYKSTVSDHDGYVRTILGVCREALTNRRITTMMLECQTDCQNVDILS